MLDDFRKLKVRIDCTSVCNSPSAYSAEYSSNNDENPTPSPTVISLGDSWSPASEIFPQMCLRDSIMLPNETSSEKGQEVDRSYLVKKHKRGYSYSKSNSSSSERVSLRLRDGRATSGTPVIRSFVCLNNMLLDYFVQDESSCDSRCLSKELEPSSDDPSIMITALPLLTPAKDTETRSLRSVEMKQKSHIMITGGPLPGFYDMKDQINGRSSWSSGDAELFWSKGSKAWLLSSTTDPRHDLCLAILQEDTINPCYSLTPWLVSSIGSAHRNELYFFKPDKGMVCTPSAGKSSFNESDRTKVEKNVIVRVRRGLGITRFIGKLDDQDGTFVGVELFTPTGLNNGTRRGVFYFEAKEDHGIFVRSPRGVIEEFGQVTDHVAAIIDNLLSSGKKLRKITKNLENRVIKTLQATVHNQSIFCACKIEILELILFYELIMIC